MRRELTDLTQDVLRQASVLVTTAVKANPNRVVYAGGVGSEQRLTSYNIDQDRIICGCYSGTLAQFKDKVYKRHKDNAHHLQEYRSMAKFFESCREAGLKYPEPVHNKCSDTTCASTPAHQPTLQECYGGGYEAGMPGNTCG